MMVHKVTLSTGKVVILRDMELGDEDLALQAVGPRAGDNNALLGSLLNKELIKLLLVQVDGKDLKPIERENLKALFSLAEFSQLVKVLQKLTGGDEGKFQIEHVTSGDK